MGGGSICVALKVVDELSGRVCGKNCSIGMSLPSIKCRIQYDGIIPTRPVPPVKRPGQRFVKLEWSDMHQLHAYVQYNAAP